ncbi:MAG: hypothetical protein KatS3mg009_2702 [Acidimicrobiia bacterium]|nr:MAG: hypothetical protein KatS3mg009_2702 [Acidimicrobiia bacterium]
MARTAGSVPGRPWYRRPRRVGALVAAALLAGAAVAFALAWRGRGAEEADVGEAVEEYRRHREEGDASGGFLLPAAGVYAYAAQGTERLSFLDTRQEWGATLPATVTHAAGCFTLRIDYSTHHWQEWDLCPRGARLEETGGRTFQRFDFVAFEESVLVELTCSPPGVTIDTTAEPGDSWTQTCRGVTGDGTETVSSGPNTFVGVETVRVGALEVETYRYRADRTIGGDREGRERFETWYSTRDGMLVKGTRSVEVRSPSPIGTVTYTEEGSFALTSLEPRR